MNTRSELTSRDIAEQGLILLCQAGSVVHGLNLPDNTDNDEVGVCIEPPEYVIGLRKFEQDVFRSKPEGVRSEPGDTDRTIYAARKFCRLALGGNPTILTVFYAPAIKTSQIGRELQALAPAFAARSAGRAFLGYATQQRQRLTGERGQMNVNRPELVDAFGYDCYADDTEFLTDRGWLLYDDIGGEDRLATLNQVSREVEFQPFVERVAKPYAGDMIEIRHRYTHALVTSNHRMFDDGRFVRADAVPRHARFHVAASPRTTDYPVDDTMLRLVGAYVSEGSIGKRRRDGTPSVLAFDQADGGNLDPYLSAISDSLPVRRYSYPREGRVGTFSRYTLADRTLAPRMVSECGASARLKRLPRWTYLLSERQSRLLLDTLMAGDGTTTRTGYRVYYTFSRELAGDVQSVAIMAGYRSNVWGPYGEMYQVLVKADDPQASIYNYQNVIRHKGWEGRVVCFTVPNETLVTRRDGRVAFHGNTKYAMHMLRLGYQGVEYLETGRLTLPMQEDERSFIFSVRRGEVDINDVLTRAGELEQRLEDLLDTSPLPAGPDYDTVNSWLVSAYAKAWEYIT